MTPLAPEKVWGDISVKVWNDRDNLIFKVWLSQIAAVLPYTNEPSTKRIINIIRDILVKANDGDITSKEGIYQVLPMNIFSDIDFNDIRINIHKLGPLSFMDSND
ncbi:MAG: hypothetical protein WC942_11825 [Clostridia bacterium]|jgi:hypothetical protein